MYVYMFVRTIFREFTLKNEVFVGFQFREAPQSTMVLNKMQF